MRFSTDKTPYKTEQAVIAGQESVGGYYLKVWREGLTTGGGYMQGAADQVSRYREAVAADSSGADLERIVALLRRRGFQIGGESLKTRPRGYDADHPRIELLRHKSLIAWRDHGSPAWLSTGSVVRHVRDDWRAIRALVEWADGHVGATSLPTPAGRRR